MRGAGGRVVDKSDSVCTSFGSGGGYPELEVIGHVVSSLTFNSNAGFVSRICLELEPIGIVWLAIDSLFSASVIAEDCVVDHFSVATSCVRFETNVEF
jgi:hypothetical protein